ncbi:MAG: hypothetical protein HRT81_12250 [Henriciella sp.]|nr:hypothetical protein [Henriciella sp.]
MSKQSLPEDSTPLSPWEYWQESWQTWADFSQRTGQIMMSQVGQKRGRALASETDAETFASELLRTLSDMNLRHWQNTARLLESYPNWMNLPNSMAGSALVDWFDNFQRQATGATAKTTAPQTPAADQVGARPTTLSAPKGKADDLTKIKGIGPKLSHRLNEMGIYHFKQIAEWSDQEVQWVDDYLSSKGRVGRESWVSQARRLTANGSATLH